MEIDDEDGGYQPKRSVAWSYDELHSLVFEIIDSRVSQLEQRARDLEATQARLVLELERIQGDLPPQSPRVPDPFELSDAISDLQADVRTLWSRLQLQKKI